jgi:hypothetical protein
MRTLSVFLVAVALLAGSAIGVAAQDQGLDGPDAGPGQAISDKIMEVWATGDEAQIEAIYAPDVMMMIDGEEYAADRDGIKSVIRGAIGIGNTYRQVGPVIDYVDSGGDLYVGTIVEVNGMIHQKGDPVVGFYRVRDGKVIRHILLYGPEY